MFVARVHDGSCRSLIIAIAFPAEPAGPCASVPFGGLGGQSSPIKKATKITSGSIRQSLRPEGNTAPRLRIGWPEMSDEWIGGGDLRPSCYSFGLIEGAEDVEGSRVTHLHMIDRRHKPSDAGQRSLRKRCHRGRPFLHPPTKIPVPSRLYSVYSTYGSDVGPGGGGASRTHVWRLLMQS